MGVDQRGWERGGVKAIVMLKKQPPTVVKTPAYGRKNNRLRPPKQPPTARKTTAYGRKNNRLRLEQPRNILHITLNLRDHSRFLLGRCVVN